MDAYMAFHERHERLKNYVHNGFRYPLPKWGRAVMGFVYFSMPIIGGYHVMQWAISKSHESIGVRGTLHWQWESWLAGRVLMKRCFLGEKLQKKQIEGIGDKVIVDGEAKKVGAGGLGGGVNLAVSSETVQERNQRMLKKFLKKQRKLMRKREKEAEEAKEASAN